MEAVAALAEDEAAAAVGCDLDDEADDEANEAGAGDPSRLPEPAKGFIGGGLYSSSVRRWT